MHFLLPQYSYSFERQKFHLLYFVYYIASLQIQFDADVPNCTITAARTCPFMVLWLNGTEALISSSDVTMDTMDTLTVTLPLNVMIEDYQSYTCVGRDNKTMMRNDNSK